MQLPVAKKWGRAGCLLTLSILGQFFFSLSPRIQKPLTASGLFSREIYSHVMSMQKSGSIRGYSIRGELTHSSEQNHSFVMGEDGKHPPSEAFFSDIHLKCIKRIESMWYWSYRFSDCVWLQSMSLWINARMICIPQYACDIRWLVSRALPSPAWWSLHSLLAG